MARGLLRQALHAFGIKRSANSYNIFATHLPVLVGLARLFTIRSAVEFGCGQYSTLTFLNSTAFPDLETLHSYETDPTWTAQVRASAGSDSRFRITSVAPPMRDIISSVTFADYDLVFVDDSLTYEDRAETISVIADNCSAKNLVVIHDYESPLYQKAASSFRHRFAFTAFTPQTGLVWNDSQVDESRLRKLNGLIKQESRRYKPDDLTGWMKLIENRNWPR